MPRRPRARRVVATWGPEGPERAAPGRVGGGCGSRPARDLRRQSARTAPPRRGGWGSCTRTRRRSRTPPCSRRQNHNEIVARERLGAGVVAAVVALLDDPAVHP